MKRISGPLIESSIRKLGFDPKNIKWLLAGHSHVDHVGGHAYMKRLTGAQVATAAQEVGIMETGGKGQFYYDGVPASAGSRSRWTEYCVTVTS